MRAIHMLAIVTRLLLGGVFLASSVPKIAVPDRFFTNVMEYGWTGPAAAAAVTLVLPWLELLLGLALLAGVLLPGAFSLSALLLAAFIGLQAWAVATGLESDCGCFALAEDAGKVRWLTVGRTGLLFVVAVSGCWVTSHTDRARRGRQMPPSSELLAVDPFAPTVSADRS